MPHSTRGTSATRIPSFKFPSDTRTSARTSMEKFPDHIELPEGQYQYPLSPTRLNGFSSGPSSSERWMPRRQSALKETIWNGQLNTGTRHNRQKSLSDALRTIRTRRGSVSQNVHEIGDALKVPVSPKLIVCSPSKSKYLALIFVDTVSGLVFLKCSYEYFFQSYT